MPKTKQWIVTTSPDRPIRDVARDLEGAGFSVGNVLDEIQCIIGTAADDAVARVRAVDGVKDVSPDEPVDVGPPDAPEGW